MQADHPKIIELLAKQQTYGRILIGDLMAARAKWSTIAQVAMALSSLDEVTNNLSDDHPPMAHIQGERLEVGYANSLNTGAIPSYSSQLLDLSAVMSELSRLEQRFFEALEELAEKTARLETGAGTLNTMAGVAQRVQEQAVETTAQDDRTAAPS